MTGQSPAIDALAKALATAQGEFPAIEPDGVGQVGGGIDKATGQKRDGRKYKYATLANMIEATRHITSKNGLSVVQTCEPSDRGTIRITTTLLHESGQWLSGTAILSLANDTPQGYGSAMTYARRYQYAAVLGVAPEDDDDGHEGSRQQPQQAARQQRPQQAQPPKAAAPANQPAANGNGQQPGSPLEAMPYDAATKEAITYLGQKLKPKGYTSTADVMREMKAAKLGPKALIGVLIKTLPDLTGGAPEPPAVEPPAEPAAYVPSDAEVDFYGSMQAAIEHHQREAAQAQQPAPVGARP